MDAPYVLRFLIVALSVEEAGYYLATYKQFEHKPPDLIKERVDKDYYSMLRTALTSISKVNKTDVETLRTSFGVSTVLVSSRGCDSHGVSVFAEPCCNIQRFVGATAESARIRAGQSKAHTRCIQQALPQSQHERAPYQHTAPTTCQSASYK